RLDELKQILAPAEKELVPLILSATRVTIFSLDSGERFDETEKDRFRGYKILGKIELTSGPELTRLQRDMVEGVFPANAIGAFYPQYGFRFEGGKAPFECVACFETFQCDYKNPDIKDPMATHVAFDSDVRTSLDQLFDGRGIPRDKT